MTPTPTKPSRTRRPARRRPRGSSPGAPDRRPRAARANQRRSRRLAHYLDGSGREREVIAQRGFAGSTLVVDRDADTLEDGRLIAHLAADEPSENATVVCRIYLQAVERSRAGCRPLERADLRTSPLVGEVLWTDWPAAQRDRRRELTDRCGGLHVLGLVPSGMSIPELRWQRVAPDETLGRTVSTREAIAALESYEPVRALSRSALVRHRDDPHVSVTVLRAEIERVLESSIVLNRGLREAVLAAVQREDLSMSEIAIRCGRVKRDQKGGAAGETSWLARRLGLLPEGGHATPTPWIHSDVLALISRDGLGISPREVEL